MNYVGLKDMPPTEVAQIRRLLSRARQAADADALLVASANLLTATEQLRARGWGSLPPDDIGSTTSTRHSASEPYIQRGEVPRGEYQILTARLERPTPGTEITVVVDSSTLMSIDASPETTIGTVQEQVLKLRDELWRLGKSQHAQMPQHEPTPPDQNG